MSHRHVRQHQKGSSGGGKVSGGKDSSSGTATAVDQGGNRELTNPFVTHWRQAAGRGRNPRTPRRDLADFCWEIRGWRRYRFFVAQTMKYEL
jgi:hypothetical protein